MLELGPVPGDLLLLQAFYPFANNINVLLCTAVFTYECRQIASAEKDGVREYCSKRAGELSFGQASSIMLKPDVERCFLLVTWAPLVRHLHKCHLYSSQCGAGERERRPSCSLWEDEECSGVKATLHHFCLLSASALSLQTWVRHADVSCSWQSCFVIVLPAHCIQPARHVVCVYNA